MFIFKIANGKEAQVGDRVWMSLSANPVIGSYYAMKGPVQGTISGISNGHVKVHHATRVAEEFDPQSLFATEYEALKHSIDRNVEAFESYRGFLGALSDAIADQRLHLLGISS